MAVKSDGITRTWKGFSGAVSACPSRRGLWRLWRRQSNCTKSGCGLFTLRRMECKSQAGNWIKRKFQRKPQSWPWNHLRESGKRRKVRHQKFHHFNRKQNLFNARKKSAQRLPRAPWGQNQKQESSVQNHSDLSDAQWGRWAERQKLFSFNLQHGLWNPWKTDGHWF